MGKHVLLKETREKIKGMFSDGLSSLEVFDAVYEESVNYVKSDEQLLKCIASLKGKVSIPEKGEEEKFKATKSSKIATTLTPPKPKPFDATPYEDVIKGLTATTPGFEFENACSPIVLDILRNYEEFDKIIDANEVGGFHNPPFDFLGFKDDDPFIIEFKGSLEHFNSPGETQKGKMQELLKRIDGLNIALLQVKLKESVYRILYNEDMDLLFDGKPIPIEPVVKWVKEQIKQRKP